MIRGAPPGWTTGIDQDKGGFPESRLVVYVNSLFKGCEL